MALGMFSQAKGAFRAARAQPQRPFAEINVTPLVDVMLVLLVVFMVTAPLVARTLGLELPQSAAAQPRGASPALALELLADGQVRAQGQTLAGEALLARLREAARQDPDTEVQLRADARVPHGQVVALMTLVQQAGLKRMGFVADAPPAAR